MSNPSAATDLFTRRLLVEAGIGTGMSVLDLGCGTGKVSQLVAELVGPGGRVYGVDRQAAALERAAAACARAGLAHVTFFEQDLGAPLRLPSSVDAIVARRVLMYLPDPAQALRRALSALAPDGVVAVQEIDSTMTPGRTVEHPLHDRVNRWIWQTVAAEGANVRMGFALPGVFEAAGLHLEGVRAEADIEGHPGTLSQVAGAILPRMVAHGIATEAAVDLPTLEARLASERERVGSLYVRCMTFGVWGRRAG